ncbi:MAG: hypothetical protein HOO96_30595, partial [Polyangiaceae bacterium]|nr:hypothetical protein [Polyangiaceae bacterium]
MCSVHSNTTQSASIQSAANLAWLNGPDTDLLDGSGKFKGACGPDDVVTATNDPDGDGIPARCDNSPQPNPDQGDRDGDGTPDVDDNCPYDANDQTNSNSEEEQRLGFPARGDVCDPNPLTLAALTPCDPNPASGFGCGDSRVDGAVRTTSVPVRQVPVSACGGAHALTWDVANGNRFDGTSFVGGKFVDQFARTRLLRCQCDETSTDAQCAALGCDRTTPASPASRWRSTTVTEGGATITDAATSLVPTFHPDLTRGGRLPDSRNLAWAYWKDPDITVPGTPSRATVEVWQGLAWAWVKDWDAIVYPTPSGPVRDPATAALRQSTRTVARMHVRESTPLLGGIRYCSPVDRNFGRIPTRIRPDWWNGGDVLVDIGTTETNPTDTWGAHVGGLPDISAEKLLDAWTAKAFRDPKLTFLAPTDAPRWWGAGYAGAVVDVNASRVASRVRFAGTSLEAEREPVDAGKPFTYLLVAALSGRRQEVAFFSDRTSGDVVQAARVYNLATGSSSSRPYDVTGQSEVLKNPVAATYRAEDDAYYVLDKVDVMRLLRVVPKVHVETVATWPLGSVYTTGYGLTTGADGSLVATQCFGSPAAELVTTRLPSAPV